MSLTLGRGMVGRTLGGAAAFDPATLNLTGWYRSNYGGAPWVPTASAGASGTNGNFVTNGNDPAAGATQNGYTPADFDGTNDNLRQLTTIDTAFFTTTAGTIICLAYADSANAPTGNVYDDITVWRNSNANEGLSYTTSGWTGFVYDGAYKSLSVACATGAYHLVMMTWNGSVIGMTLDSAAETTAACGTLTMGGDAISMGVAYGGGDSFDGRILELMTADVKLSGTDYANIKSYVNSRYALAL